MLSVVLWMLCGAHFLIALRWAWGMFEVARTPVTQSVLPPLPQRAMRPDDPSLSVLIPAHNEADNIETCLTRLGVQNYAPSQIVVINDRSSDATGAVIRRLGLSDPRITLVEIEQLPDGWIGKCHALAQGAARATGDYLLFLDSDVYLQAGALAAVMDKAYCDNIDFLTLWPRLGLRSLADRLLIPPVGWLLSFWALHNKGRLAADRMPVMGNGQFLLIRRHAYDRIGGHGAVRSELAEDAMLAQLAHAAHLHRWIGMGQGLYCSSRDGTLRRSTDGLARTLIGSLVSPVRVLLSTQILLTGCVLPFWLGPLCLVLTIWGVAPILTSVWTAVCALHLAAMFATLRGLFAMTLENRAGIWLFPIGCMAAVLLLVRCLFIMGGHTSLRWGATRYAVRGSRILSDLGDQNP